MGWNAAAYPTWWTTITSAKHGHLFLDTDPLAFTLNKSGAAAYEVRDYYGATVRSGAVAGTSLTLAALPRGWYRLLLFGPSSDATYGTLYGASMFSVLAPDTRLAAPPAAGTAVGVNPGFENADQIIRGVALTGPYRHTISDAANPHGTVPNQNIETVQAESAYVQSWYEANPDSARPRPSFVQFPNGGYQTTAHTDGVTATVAALYPTVKYFEGPVNEPDLRNTWASQAQTFRAAVKAGNPNAKVMGPCPVTFNGSRPGLVDLDAFIAAGGAAGFDALSVHPYNCDNGDITLARKSLTALRAMLTKYGLQNLELWQTEWGTFACTYGIYNPRRQVRWAMLHRLMLEQFGIPKERDYWFYDTSHGFWDFPSWLKNADGTMNPLLAAMRVYGQELFGKTHAVALDFGTVENDHYAGSRFAAADGSSVLVLISGGRTGDPVKLKLTGAASVVAVDCFGNTSTLAADAKGLVSVPVTCEPIYVRLPAGVTATVEQVGYGSNVTQWGGFGSTPTGPDSQRVVDGVLEDWYYQGPTEPTEWRDTQDVPSSMTLRFDATGTKAHRIDTVIVHCPTPWQDQSALTDFDVEYRKPDGTWVVAKTITEPIPEQNDVKTNQSQIGCTVEHYHSGRCIFVVTFAPAVATAVRISARGTTAGGESTPAAVANAGGQGTSYQRMRIREVSVHCRDTLVPRPVVLF